MIANINTPQAAARLAAYIIFLYHWGDEHVISLGWQMTETARVCTARIGNPENKADSPVVGEVRFSLLLSCGEVEVECLQDSSADPDMTCKMRQAFSLALAYTEKIISSLSGQCWKEVICTVEKHYRSLSQDDEILAIIKKYYSIGEYIVSRMQNQT